MKINIGCSIYAAKKISKYIAILLKKSNLTKDLSEQCRRKAENPTITETVMN